MLRIQKEIFEMSGTSSLPSGMRTIMILVGILVVFVLPYGYHVDLGPGPNGFMAISWELPMNGHLMPFSALEYFIYYLYRLVVLRAIWRLSLGKIGPKRVMFHGLIAEHIPIRISIPGMLFLNTDGENYIPIMIPLPFLLIYVKALVFSVGKRNAS
jgi:hypothetical protein